MIRTTLAAFALLTLSSPQESPPLDGYRDWKDHVRALLELERAGVDMSVLGKTIGGREVHRLRIGADDRPAILIVGSVHAPHVAGSELAVRIAKLLATHDDAKAARERVTFYVIPRPSPDATERAFAAPRRERSGNERKTDDDRDSRSGEDGPDDLDGDGWITMMRVEDETGGWIEHPDDPRVLVRAEAKQGETGRWALHVEGRDDDGDRAFNEDAGDGVDFNRNWTHKYPYFGRGAGPHQVSEAETRAVADFCFDRKNIAMVFSFSPEDNLQNPWKPDGKGGRIPMALAGGDGPYIELFSEEAKRLLEAKDAPGSPGGEGSFVDWAYFHYGRWSLASRGWWIPRVEPEKDKAPKDPRAADELNALRWFDREGIDGFRAWTKIDHPDFPGRRVEVGGFRPFRRLNPPAKELDALAERHVRLILRLAELLPVLRVPPPKVEDLGEGCFRVTADVVNAGVLPTESEMGGRTRKPQPLQASLDLPEGASLVAGVARVRLDRIDGGAKREHAWVVRGGAGGTFRVTVWSPSVGTASAEGVLK